MNVQRVMMTADTVGGVWTFTLELAEVLAARGVEVILASFGGKASECQILEAKRVPGLCLLDSDYKLEWMDDPWDDVDASGRWLTQLAQEYRPDVVHLNTFGHGHLPWTSPVVITAHSCVLSWWQAVKAEAAPASWNRYRDLVTKSLSLADLVTAPSSAMASALSLHYGLDRAACRVIPNARRASRFHCANKEPIVLTAGRLWDEGKNVTPLVRIAPPLSWPVYLAGDSGTHVAQGCRMLGHLSASELASWYARAAIYAMPALYEPFGLSILEAALSGCALVLGDIASLREIWQDAAVFVSPREPAELQKQLESLITDASRREELAQLAYARALNFHPARLADGYLKSYADAISLRSGQCVS